MTNIEFKARLRNPEVVRRVLDEYNLSPAAILHQTDTYFQATNGRLKLREIAGETAQLIFYERADRAGIKRSDYSVAPVAEAAALSEVLSAAHGIRVVVRKKRELYLLPRRITHDAGTAPSNSIRLHLDTVEGLGQFIEIEVIVAEGESTAPAQEEARTWATELGLAPEDFVSSSYADLLESRKKT